jgi:hypothetical protein
VSDAVVAERAAGWFEAWLAGAWRGLAGARVAFTDLPLPDAPDRGPASQVHLATANSWS